MGVDLSCFRCSGRIGAIRFAKGGRFGDFGKHAPQTESVEVYRFDVFTCGLRSQSLCAFDFEESAWLGSCLKVDVRAIGNAFKSNTGSGWERSITGSHCLLRAFSSTQKSLRPIISPEYQLRLGIRVIGLFWLVFILHRLFAFVYIVSHMFSLIWPEGGHGVGFTISSIRGFDLLGLIRNQPHAVVGILAKAAAHHHAPPYRPLQLSWSLRHLHHHLLVYGSPSGVSTESPVHHLA
ncbi:hypothetical protein M5K25_008328 [Dendrobium thyrsiflorum]|uniref:Uncharacterized protein n=1 Tax=Dendrobium thyrsiflorum TaxID=117978 RepID=A0ABD0V985_DENTH